MWGVLGGTDKEAVSQAVRCYEIAQEVITHHLYPSNPLRFLISHHYAVLVREVSKSLEGNENTTSQEIRRVLPKPIDILTKVFNSVTFDKIPQDSYQEIIKIKKTLEGWGVVDKELDDVSPLLKEVFDFCRKFF